MKTAYDIIIRPIITEQSMEDLDIKKYAFEVAKDANKIEIKKAIEEIFDVKVINVTTTAMHGKTKRQGAYPQGRTASWKKAVVKLSADSKNIELFEGMV
ncbi:MAG: 50S ribosomal protein L23 [Oscillospiraceae bacterium]|nr:50S ribosomal protein L23 [Kiritimatiellia bacterium]MBQ3703649.1 50S ribosomal protein L23 [Oscillospiraceae bacterium]MBQ3704784.1 50S ribosomal protein L23 [Oscillospiraceae bacterium]